MLTIVIGFIIAIILMAVEYILCTRFKNPLWGGIIPMLILIGTVCIFTAEIVPFELHYVFPFIILNTIFLETGVQEEKNTIKSDKLNLRK